MSDDAGSGNVNVPRRSNSTSPRRQRTVSESGVDEENINSEIEVANEAEDHNMEHTITETEDDESDTEMGSDSENDSENDSEDDENEDSEGNDSEYYSDDEFQEEFNPILGQFGSETQSDLLHHLQSVLLGAASANGGAGITLEEMDRLRQTVSRMTRISTIGGPSTHSSHIKSILRTLPSSATPPVDPMHLFSLFTQLFELIVLTGEELESYEFDTVIDLKVLLPHLLRVLRWNDPECQIYGTEFLLIAIKCTRAIIQYSPASAKRFVDSGLIPLLTIQLLSAEYIDVAEDLIQMICLLSKSDSYTKACLHADGIKAVLGFIDFFALPVQIYAFTSVAQMTTALTVDTFNLYFTEEMISILQTIIRRYSGNSHLDDQESKVVNWSLKALHNALVSCSSASNNNNNNAFHSKLFPIDFIETSLFPLCNQMPLDTAKVLLSLSSHVDLKNLPGIEQIISSLMLASKNNEELLEITIKLICAFVTESPSNAFCFDLIDLLLKSKFNTHLRNKNNTYICPVSILKLIDENLMKMYLNSAALSSHSRHLILSALLLINLHLNVEISLEKVGLLVQIVSTADKNIVNKIVGLEWCLHYITEYSVRATFQLYSRRQGLASELINARDRKDGPVNNKFVDLISKRLESLGVTVFSGDEENTSKIYTNFVIKKVLEVLICNPNNTDDVRLDSAAVTVTYDTIEELFDMLESNKLSFTEYELLGDLEGSECNRIITLLKHQQQLDDNRTVQWRPGVEILCKMLNNSFNRYDSYFKLINSSTSNRSSMNSLAHLSRPIHLQVNINGHKKILPCDPFSTISWIARISTADEEEKRMLLNVSMLSGVVTSVQDSEPEITDTPTSTYPSRIKQVTLHYANNNIPLNPSSSLLEILFKHVVTAGNDDQDVALKIKKISEVWSKLDRFYISIATTSDHVTVPSSTDNTQTTVDDAIPARLRLALDLLALLPSPPLNSVLVDKLTKELNSSLLIALNSIPDYWIHTVKQYPFLFPIGVRVSLMRATCFGRLRALNDVQSRTNFAENNNNNNNNNSNINAHGVSFAMPRRKFRIDRAELLNAMKVVLQSSDFRVFEFEYEGELGSGHGPTLEFYTMAAIQFTKSTHNLFYNPNSDLDLLNIDPGNGYFPDWKCAEINAELYELMGCFIARAWLDDRIFDLPLHELFVKSQLASSEYSLNFSDLEKVDSALYNSIQLIPCDGSIAFMIPGTDISLAEGTIVSEADKSHFQQLFMTHINRIVKEASTAFTRGFNKISPTSFPSITAFFTLNEVSDLLSPPLCAWTADSIVSSLVTDHGYHKDSPQIRWLAEIIADLETRPERAQFIQFLTGAAFLPIGGWDSLQPRLTIVCKTFDSSSSTASAASTSSLVRSPEISNQSDDSNNNHDIYLPSVMTCANYLKLPRYSSKEIMQNRFNYAIKEASGSFYLS